MPAFSCFASSPLVRRALGAALVLAPLLSLPMPAVGVDDEPPEAKEGTDRIVLSASTAYAVPDHDALRDRRRETEAEGIVWTGSGNRVVWFGRFESAGSLDAFVSMTVRADGERPFRLGTAGKFVEGEWRTGDPDGETGIRFAGLQIPSPGWHGIELECPAAIAGEVARVQSLSLEGEPVVGAHFNTDARRNAASVHLFYPTPKEAKIDLFHVEVIADEDPIHTFYMACGFHRGYLGMQVNSETERRIIFSVWDSGNEAVDRSKVAREDLVQLVAKGEDVHASGFGNEGTGGHSHLKYLWKTGTPQRFAVSAEPVDGTHTIYSGYYLHPERNAWMLIASFKAPKDGGYLKGLHSFSENFWGSTGHLRRKARFGSQWFRTADAEWHELATARFSHDPTGRELRLDRFMGLEGGHFFLSHGGFKEGFTAYGEELERPPSPEGPPRIDLPKP